MLPRFLSDRQTALSAVSVPKVSTAAPPIPGMTRSTFEEGESGKENPACAQWRFSKGDLPSPLSFAETCPLCHWGKVGASEGPGWI